MIYAVDITTTKNTAKVDATRTALKVTKGLVYEVEILFPPGPLGNLYVSIFDGGFQVWPSSPDVWFHSDRETIEFDETYLVDAAPFQFDIYTYNLDTAYDHYCQVRIAMVSKEVFMARYLPTYTYDYFLKLMEQMAAEQEAARLEYLSKPLPWVMK